MALPVYRLRRILATTAILFTAVVAGMYFYARSKATNVLKAIPNKIGVDIKQTASGFQISKSDGKRTLFTVQASSVKQFKLNGNAELHNVSIILYGRDSSRFDQIYGEDFAYNQKTGDVTANGEVQIDLVANPAGLASPDQATPKELKNPIHLKTRDLVFNKDTGNAYTHSRVEVLTPQASGWAVGLKYAAKGETLTLESEIHLSLTGPESAVIEAQSGTITNDPRQIVLDHPAVARAGGTLSGDRATFQLSQDNHVERVLAEGNVKADTFKEVHKNPPARREKKSSAANQEMHVSAEKAEFLFVHEKDVLQTATLSGKVHVEQAGVEPLSADAGRVFLEFTGENHLQQVRASEEAHLKQSGSRTGEQPAQDIDLTAAVIDFDVAQGHILRRANTSGPARITILQLPEDPSSPQRPAQQTVVTAGRFDANFSHIDGHTRLTGMSGAPDVRIVNTGPDQPERVSTSDSVKALFQPQGGLAALNQAGNVHYVENPAQNKQIQAWANSARYTPTDQMLMLSGNPRVESGGMETTSDRMRINRLSGDAFAEGNVKSTYSELKEQPSGALLASATPIHITSGTMMVGSKAAGVATYSGNARLWQDANMIESPTIEFNRERRSVIALGSSQQPVKTTLVEPRKMTADVSTAGSKQKAAAGPSPISITGLKLSYVDSERKVHYEGGILAKAVDFSASAKVLDAYLLSRSEAKPNPSGSGPGQVDHIVAEGDIVIQQQDRRAEGQKLVYTAADDRFVLTGGSPSIFDAEQGKITGVSLTFFRRDDRVLVEGEASQPVVTQTRVAR